MRVVDIVQMAFEYGIRSLILLGMFGSLIAVGYFFGYKKCLKGQKKLPLVNVLASAVLFCYLLIVLWATLERGGYESRSMVWQPFTSYKMAWNSFSVIEWRNIILNIVMFMPFGFLLPMILSVFKQTRWTYLAGFLLTLVIELTQYLTGRGIFEVDDLIGNTVGCMIGYGIYQLLQSLFLKVKEKQPFKFKKLAMYQVPLLLCMSVFGTIFITYHVQELGNLDVYPLYPLNMKRTQFHLNVSLTNEPQRAMVYQTKLLNKEEAFMVADKLFSSQNTTVDETETIFYDETAIYTSADGNYSLWVDYLGPMIRFTNYAIDWCDNVSGYSEEEVLEALLPYGLEFPREGIEVVDEGNVGYQIKADLTEFNGNYLDGTLTVLLNHQKEVQSARGDMIAYDVYKEYPLLTLEEAYAKLEQGRFIQPYGYDVKGENQIEINEITLQHQLDSKGYYQPVYAFTTLINGEPQTIHISAIK